MPNGIRGIYCTLPYGDEPEKPTTCHVDGHPFHLGVVGYIDHVPPRGGGFTVWPKSHLKFYYEFHSQYKHERTDGYDDVLAEINQTPYVETYGEPGDIVFWHHRIGHAAGQNFSKPDTSGSAVRFPEKGFRADARGTAVHRHVARLARDSSLER